MEASSPRAPDRRRELARPREAARPLLLLAPVMEEGARVRRFWLPPGRWLGYDADRVHEGPAWLEWKVSLRSMPALLREGAILPRGPVMQWTDERPLAPLVVRVRVAQMAAAVLDGERPPLRSRYGELVASGGLWLDGASAVAGFPDRPGFELSFQSS